MSRPITLISESGLIVGNVMLADNCPMQPPLLALNGVIYLANDYSVYRAQPAPLAIPSEAVSKPYDEPTLVIGETAP